MAHVDDQSDLCQEGQNHADESVLGTWISAGHTGLQWKVAWVLQGLVNKSLLCIWISAGLTGP